jgi:protein-disulfide isomerase-like protein with CxxC motif
MTHTESDLDTGVCPICDEVHELFFDDVREHDAARDRARARREDAPFDERALADTDAIIDMTGMAVTSTAAILAIRAAVQYRADQAQARYLAAQHSSYEVGRGRAMVARDTWREALALVDTVIAERMS